MCGIAGFLSGRDDSQVVGNRVRLMLRSLEHRGPDHEGVWERNQVCLGHRRLAIIDLSALGNQPMVYEDSVILVLNGEIYNYKQLRAGLEAQGVQFRSRSDTEVLLHGYRVWGAEVVCRIKGFFAFAIWDADRQLLFCARDPFGKKPFYFFYRENDCFVFASEAEALIKGLAVRPDPEPVCLGHYLLKGYFPAGRSVYTGVQTLKAGHSLKVSLAREVFEETPYQTVRFELGADTLLQGQDTESACEKLLEASVQRRLQSDVPVGVLLSGGVDSSLVTLLARKNSPADLQAFTATFPGTDFDELRYAQAVTEKAGIKQTAIKMTFPDLQNLLGRLVQAYGEPFGDDSAIPSYLLFQALKSYVKVVLTGDGGDETFAGYKDMRLFFARNRIPNLLGASDILGSAFPDRLTRSSHRRLRELGHVLFALGRNGARLHESLRRRGWTAHWRRSLMRGSAWEETGRNLAEEESAQAFEHSGRSDLERYLNQTLERQTQSYLVKIDRASMSHSIEARSPFLDMDLFSFVSRLPVRKLIPKGEQKGILKHLLETRMGRDFVRRPKMGFTPPLDIWLRQGETPRWIEGNLTDPESFVYSLFEPKAIRGLLSLHLRGQNHGGRLWTLLFLNEWHNQSYRGHRADKGPGRVSGV